ncbi:reverse transcriptase domain-containing protein [Tanacetum coccineum]
MAPLLYLTHVGNSIRARHVTGLLELVSLVIRLGIWPGIDLRMVETVVEEMGTTSNLLLRVNISPTLLNYTLSISTPMKSLVIIDNEYQNCPLRFDDKIRSANLFPLDMNDFDINLGMDWLTEHRATIEVDINKKTENQAKMTKNEMEWKKAVQIQGLSSKKMQSQSSILKNSASKPEPD